MSQLTGILVKKCFDGSLFNQNIKQVPTSNELFFNSVNISRSLFTKCPMQFVTFGLAMFHFSVVQSGLVGFIKSAQNCRNRSHNPEIASGIDQTSVSQRVATGTPLHGITNAENYSFEKINEI